MNIQTYWTVCANTFVLALSIVTECVRVIPPTFKMVFGKPLYV